MRRSVAVCSVPARSVPARRSVLPRRGRKRALAGASAALALSVALSGCGLVSGSPMADDVHPGTLGRGEPLQGAELTVTSKEFTESIILGHIMGLAFQAAGAKVVDRTAIQGSIGSREAVKSGAADAMYEYTGTSWITYLGHETPIVDSHEQWEAVREEDKKEGLSWLRPSTLNNTYVLTVSPKLQKKYGVKTLSDVAELSKKNPKAASLCVDNEFAARDDGLPGLMKKYGMKIPASRVHKMSNGVVYTQTAKGTPCTFGEVYATDGRIKAMGLKVLADDRHFFPNYDAAPEINSATLEKHPEIADVLDPITKSLNNEVARELNAKVDVEGEDPHDVAKEWLVEKGFIKEG
ncbi:glycine betaine ABC transporter substrate-binding protein [Streptomyces daliensis]|uniref:Glycine betaine ABC transporter substrate-binding protein n=1 Tax=Streptomyces daliensis TaxID=299421 RepID=A0A8T4ILI8_9ACTN|nr:glycine betaine ABC transporter substrate-binding protein [Streptomyces daliensis]